MALLTLPNPRTPDPFAAPVVRWGILGTGWIADRFVHALQTHTRQIVQAVGSRTEAGAAAAAARWGVGTAYGSYAALVADPDVDIVYIATPHNHHLPDALLAIRAGKHVLVEKPVAMTADEGRQMWAAAQEAGVLCLEAMWTAFLPKFDVLRQVLDGGAEAGIGRVLSVRADQGEWFPPTHRIMNSALAGGPLLDLFTYLATLSTWTVGMPLQVTAVGAPVEPTPPASPGGINGQLSASLVTATGAVSTLYSSIVEDTPTGAVIQGTHGRIEIDGWFYRPGGFTVVIDERAYGGSGERRLRYDEPEIGHEALFWQACEAARLLTAGETRSALRPFEDTIGTLEVLDRVRLAVGFDFAEAIAERGAVAADPISPEPAADPISPEPATSPEATLDPILTAYFADLAAREVPKVWEVTPQQARDMFHIRARMMRELDPPPELSEVRDLLIPTAAGSDAAGIPARVYRPVADLPLPTVLYAHGGGWVICDIDTHDAVCRRLAVLAQAVVVSIDYRLGPEHPFPAAVDDALTAARWVGTHLAELGGSQVWAMAGDSAGGGLTAVATHVLRDERRSGAGADVIGPPMAAQLLIYPATDPAGSYESRVRLGSGYGLETESIDYFMRLYAGTSDPAALTDARLSPLRYPDHSDLPPAIVVTAGFDPLIDEDVAYLEALRTAGVTAEWQNAPGLIHGFVDLGPMIPAAAQALESMGRRLGELLRAT